MNINAIIRPVSTKCNLKCHYCYARLESIENQKSLLMPDIFLEECLNKIINSGLKYIKILWHGGEPLLAGISFFKKAVNIQNQIKKKLKNEVVIVNSIQTNGTLLNDEIVKFLKENKFNVGISLDGFEEIQNFHRKMKNGEGSYSKVINGINLLQKYKVNFGVVSVVTKKSLKHPKQIFSFFTDKNIFNIHFLPYAEIDRNNNILDVYSITAEEYGDFLEEIFEYWKELDNPLIKVRIIDNFLQGFLCGKVELCTFARSCNSHILIEEDGDVFVCGRNANNNDFFVGNILNNSLQELLQSDKFKKVSDSLNSLSESCQDCSIVNLCKGGCGYFKFLLGCDDKKDYFCESYKRLSKLIIRWLKEENVPLSKSIVNV